MSMASDLSSILTNANMAMYQAVGVEPLLSPSLPSTTPVYASMPPFVPEMGALRWFQMPPNQWSKQNVLEWISFNVEEGKFDAQSLDLACCSMEGSTLCQLSHSTLISMFGSLGEQLYQNLQELKVKYGSEDLNITWDLLSDLWEDMPDFLSGQDDYRLLSTVVVHNDDRSSSDYSGYPDGLRMRSDLSDNGYESGSASCDSSTPRNHLPPSSPESGSCDSDLEASDFKFPLSADVLVKTEPVEMKPHKRGRGRPRKLSRGPGHYAEATKSKHSPRGAHLWEFIRDILIHPEQNQGLMKWEDRREGVFKFLKSESVAQLWGQKKRNSSMTYEKLSRAMRYYYKREILERVDGRRLVYKFGKNSSGWKLEEMGRVV